MANKENIMGQRIKEKRQELHMTQNELGEKLGVQSAAIRKYECGLVQNIPRKSIEKMAEIFGVRPSWLMGLDVTAADEEQELNDYLEELKNRPEMRMMFKLAKGATKADVERAVAILEALKQHEDGNS